MMNAQKTRIALLLAASAATLALGGCGGDDGNDGNPGNPGGEPAGEIKELHFSFEQAVVKGGIPTVEFTVTNEDDMPVVGLQKFRFAAAQLLPEGATGAGNASQWQYFGNEDCTVSSSCAGTFVDHKNGSYSYTFSKTLNELSKDTISFNPELAQRVLLRAYNTPLPDGTLIPNSNAFVDFSADSGASAAYSRKLVSTDSCNTCHGDLANVKHGGAYSDVNYCATCHTSGKVKPGNEFNAMIHTKHKDLGLDALNSCQSCHNDTNVELTPDWGNWSKVPTAASCGSCHSNIDFAAGQGHSQQTDNSNCIACHNSKWTEELHTGVTGDKRAVIAQRGLTAELTGSADNSATLTVTLLDKAGNALDANNELAKIKRLETITNVGPNFPVMGYNVSPGSGKAKVAKDLVKDGQLQDAVTLVDGKLQFTVQDLPFGAGDADTAFSFIGLEMCNQGSELIACADGVATTSMKAQLAFGTKSGDAPSHRHIDSVNFATCQGCHSDTFELHKGHHAGFVMTEQLGREVNGKLTVGVDGCVACHTPDGTYASGANKGALEMKLHKTHIEKAHGLIGGNCSACHNDLNLDAFKNKGALATSAGMYTTPITATCTSCHTVGGDYMVHTKEQLEAYGAVVDGEYTAANQAAQLETCFYCHKPTAADHTQVKM
ncbi:OmcA/MtrC family decaheme c-type cytochrome [Shewanella algae]|uniref:OmcA/MtrC family decaheme c-type cytochrome n=1 Tax=Shewanella algae TaxID=38313 RepID=UPI001C5949F4|nr:OmcA/MtrC family decaheme c-type cytochrome [Shewanella algae]WKC43409.1 OmcA/MtrC family decaheme c-type cytochrome [Shewanella algae]HDS1197877.1 OmcA/MtrC family decaheme c-type cytochrome [Shewanella algae]